MMFELWEVEKSVSFRKTTILGKLVILIWIIAAHVSYSGASEVNPVYVDPLDWRLQPEYREYWIDSQQCLFNHDHFCAIQALEPMLSLELSEQQRTELHRALAALYRRLSEVSKFKNWQDVIRYAERSIEFDDQELHLNWNRDNIMTGHRMLHSWDECAEAVNLLGDPASSETEVSDISAMNASICLYNVKKYTEAKRWVEFAHQAIFESNRIDDMFHWTQDINRLQSALRKMDPTSALALSPFWWEERDFQPHASAAMKCDRKSDHKCAIKHLERLYQANLTDQQRAHVRRTLARHYSRLASPSGTLEQTDATISALRNAISFQDDPLLQSNSQGLLVHMLASKKDWNACVTEGIELFEGGEFIATENSHDFAITLGYCYGGIDDKVNARKWVAQARRLAQQQGSFIRENWAWLLEHLSMD